MIPNPRPGDRIRLVTMHGDPDPIQPGQVGTIIEVRGYERDTWLQVEVAWDNGRTLMLVSPPDRFELVAATN